MIMIETIQTKHKKGIQTLLENLNRVDHLGYSLTDEWLDYMIETTSESIFVATDRGEVRGIATCMMNETDKTHAVITIAVDPQYRRRGIGSKLYDQVSRYGEEKQIEDREAYVKERLDEGIQFANKRGFNPAFYAWQMDLELSAMKTDLTGGNHDELTFRKATSTDHITFAAIINETFGDLLDQNILKQLLKDPSIQVYMLEKEGKVIGSLTIQYRTNLSVGYIYDVAIIESCRGQGYGTYMLTRCIQLLKDKEIETASLTVTGENKKALGLYQKLGFKEVDTDIILKSIKNFRN